MQRWKLCLILGAVAVVIIIVTVVLIVTLLPLKPTFIKRFEDFKARSEEFKGYDCQTIWGLFEQAYVGKDPCKVPTEAYDPLMAAVPFKHDYSKIFWSKTKDVVHRFTEKRRDCFYSMKQTLLGSVLDGLKWCGKEGSSKTIYLLFATCCPEWNFCTDNPYRSFWNRVSAAFADAAYGDVTVMLSGSSDKPFDPNSVFASVEVKRFYYPRVTGLNVVLVTQKNSVTNCMNPTLNNLQKELNPGITYNCKEVPETQIEECSSNPETPCGACW